MSRQFQAQSPDPQKSPGDEPEVLLKGDFPSTFPEFHSACFFSSCPIVWSIFLTVLALSSLHSLLHLHVASSPVNHRRPSLSHRSAIFRLSLPLARIISIICKLDNSLLSRRRILLSNILFPHHVVIVDFSVSRCRIMPDLSLPKHWFISGYSLTHPQIMLHYPFFSRRQTLSTIY